VEELARVEEPDRPRLLDELERLELEEPLERPELDDPLRAVDVLRDDDEVACLRAELPLEEPPCSSPESSLPRSFFATAAAAGTATPNAAPATTFFVVELPSVASSAISLIICSLLGCASAIATRLVEG